MFYYYLFSFFNLEALSIRAVSGSNLLLSRRPLYEIRYPFFVWSFSSNWKSSSSRKAELITCYLRLVVQTILGVSVNAHLHFCSILITVIFLNDSSSIAIFSLKILRTVWHYFLSTFNSVNIYLESFNNTSWFHTSCF